MLATVRKQDAQGDTRDKVTARAVGPIADVISADEHY